MAKPHIAPYRKSLQALYSYLVWTEEDSGRHIKMKESGVIAHHQSN